MLQSVILQALVANKVRNPTYSAHMFSKMYVFAQICYQHVILPNFHVLTTSIAAMDQKLHFWPPGGQF